jgi:hypothetical protein
MLDIKDRSRFFSLNWAYYILKAIPNLFRVFDSDYFELSFFLRTLPKLAAVTEPCNATFLRG